MNVQMHCLSQELRLLLHYYAVHPKVKPGHGPSCFMRESNPLLWVSLLCTSSPL